MFRESTKKPIETHPHFHTRAHVIFEKWMKIEEAERMYEGLQEVLVMDHVLSRYKKELMISLAKRELKMLEDIGAIKRLTSRLDLDHLRERNVPVT